jgi:hypothetical protein
MKQINISETCVFLQLSLSRMGDKRGVSSDEIEVDADKDLVKVRKVIFKSAAFDAIKSLDSEVRRYVRSQCFPYDAGLHLTPLLMVDSITARLHSYLRQRLLLVDHFGQVLPVLAENIAPRLRKLHNNRDYDLKNALSQFSMGWQFLMVTAPMNLESINSELARKEHRKMQERWADALEEARLLLRETCLNLVSHLRTSLENDAYGAPKRLSTSTVRNLQEFFDNFRLRDITDDQEMKELIDRGKSLLGGIDAESLRTADGLRARVRSELNEIEQAVTATLTTAPTRRIRVRDASE